VASFSTLESGLKPTVADVALLICRLQNICRRAGVIIEEKACGSRSSRADQNELHRVAGENAAKYLLGAFKS
jgi:hypothetical protein